MNISEGLTFDDVLLVPKYSDISSRDDIDTSVTLGKGINLKIPLISANMKHVTGPLMAKTIASLGGMALLHRFAPMSEQVASYFDAIEDSKYVNNVGVSVGVKSHDEIVTLLRLTNSKIVCVDVAHGHSKDCINTVRFIRETFPNVLLIAGNVVTEDAVKSLAASGADVVKVGVGPGSLCTTRIETGNGVPQLTALNSAWNCVRTHFLKKEQASVSHEAQYKLTEYGTFDRSVKIIADGGIKNSGDIVKALCRSDCVMIGSLFAGTAESPGEIQIDQNGNSFKEYSGSSTFKSKHVEGIESSVPYVGSVIDVVDRLMQGVRSGMSYQGVRNLEALKRNVEFIKITNSGLIESKPRI